MRPFSFLVATTALTPLVWAQEHAAPRSNHPTPITISDPPGFTVPTDKHEAPRANIDRGTPAVFDVLLDDEVPRPGAKFVESGTVRDTVDLHANTAQNPFFLGFAAGSYAPSEGERIDPQLASTAMLAPQDGRPAPTVYAFVMFGKRITQERTSELEALGVRVLGFHPNYAIKVAMAPEKVAQVAALPFVRWIGTPRAWQKRHPMLTDKLASTAPDEMLELYVNVFESDVNESSTSTPSGALQLVDNGGLREVPQDPAQLGARMMSNGWQQHALQEQGAEVVQYIDSIRAFRVHVSASAVERLANLDFVQFVEEVPLAQSLHDESTPMVHSDVLRNYVNGGTSQGVVAGEIDSGINTSHQDLGIYGVGWDFSGSNGAWNDACGHGSHVAGTILGRGDAKPENRGNAPGLGFGSIGRFYNSRIFASCASQAVDLASVMGVMHNSYNDGIGNTIRPMVINNSWGSGPGGGQWTGSEGDARLLDSETFNYAQLYVFAAGNDGAVGKIYLQGGAKDVLTVGSVTDHAQHIPPFLFDAGLLSSFSSRGPMADGRWKPNVCAPGENVTSVAAGTLSSYTTLQGTSMATPHVTGVAADVMDANAFLRYAPARLSSVLMANAITKDDTALTSQYDQHLRDYGTGRVDAYRSTYGTSQLGWSNWGFTLGAGQGTYADFTIGAGCKRIVVCMTYYENACSAGASKALVNDWDLYIDQAPFDPNLNAGEWTAGLSGVDNTEIRYIENPSAGSYRWKAYPYNATSSANFGVTLSVVYGDTKPDGALYVSTSNTYVRPNQDVDVTGTVYNPTFIASAVDLLSTAGSGSYIIDSAKYIGDGVLASLLDNDSNGVDMQLGNVLHDSSRSGTWRYRYLNEGVKSFNVSARSDNWIDRSTTFNVTVDGTAPSIPANLQSTTHTDFIWSNYPYLGMSWNASTDNLSGVAGYSIELSQDQPVFPDDTIDIGVQNSWTSNYLPTTGHDYYFSIRAVDRCGNASAGFAAEGPFRIDTNAPPAPANIVSTSHTVGVPSCGTQIDMIFDNAVDLESGTAGYEAVIDQDPATVLGGTINTQALGYSQVVSPSAAGYYFHICTVDYAGNVGLTATEGPYFVDPCTGTITAFCFGDGSGASCPCGTFGAAGNGCPNSVHPEGANLAGSGIASVGNDSVVLDGSLMPNATALYFQGNTADNGGAGVVFGDGLHCVSGGVKRLGSKTNVGGASSYPIGGDPLISVKGLVNPGDTKYYQCFYRNAASFCTSATFNYTNAVQIDWVP